MSNISYFGDNIPNKLSENEFEYYYRLYKDGDLLARDILIEHNIKLVVYVAREFSGVFYEIDELISAGMIGLIKAIDTFDIDKYKKISPYAYKCIKNEMLMYIRNNNKHENVLSVDEMLNDENGEKIDSYYDMLIDYNVNIENDYYKMEFRNNFINFMKKILTEKELKIVLMYFGFYGNRKYIQEEISTYFGIARYNVSKIITRSLNKIKKQILLEIEDINSDNYLNLMSELVCFDGKLAKIKKK